MIIVYAQYMHHDVLYSRAKHDVILQSKYFYHLSIIMGVNDSQACQIFVLRSFKFGCKGKTALDIWKQHIAKRTIQKADNKS